MSKELPLYKRPLKTNLEPKFSVEKWTKAEELFEEKKYKESVVEVFNYINSDLLKGISRKKEIKADYIHGICKVSIDINKDRFKIKAQMVEIDEDTNLVALLRRVAELNFHYNDVAFIIFKDNKIYYEFEEKIELCEPNKVYYTARDVVFSADKYANELIQYYGAKEIENLTKDYLTPKDTKEALAQIRDYLGEYDDYVEYFTSNSKSAYVWDISTITLLKLSNMTYLNGVYKDEIISKISMLYDGDLDFDYRIDNAKKYIKSLQELSDKDFKKVLYHRNDIFSMLKLASNDSVKTKLNNYEETLLKYEKNDNHYAMSYYLEELFLKLIYEFNLEKSHKDLIHNAILKASKSDTKSSSKEFVKIYNKLREIDYDQSVDTALDYVKNYWWVAVFVIYIIVKLAK